LTAVLSSPLLLLFKAILDARTAASREVGMEKLGYFGAPVIQLFLFAPLEFFGYTFVFWIPLIVYGAWKNIRKPEVTAFIAAFVVGFATLILLADTTPVFLRYVLLLVPVLVTIGLIPVAEFLDDAEHTTAQKWFILGSFGIFYIAVTVFMFWSGLYTAKGTYFV
jgi:hypothetical protein